MAVVMTVLFVMAVAVAVVAWMPLPVAARVVFVESVKGVLPLLIRLRGRLRRWRWWWRPLRWQLPLW